MDNLLINKYDYIIIGAGPSGLTTGWILSQTGKKVLIIDREKTIGGCHRVRRINGYFTEHGPRIYTSAYLNTKAWLENMNLNYNDYFTDYNFNMTSIGKYNIGNIKLRYIFKFIIEFCKMIINNNHGRDITVLNFMKKNNFDQNTINYIDRLCRVTDGAGAYKYTLFELLNIANQNFFYKIQQPNKPMDVGLLKDIYNIMKNHVTFMFNTNINKINRNGVYTNSGFIKSDNIILALPPLNLMNIMYKSKMINGWDNIVKWSLNNTYNIYIPITFHWDSKINLPNKWGFSDSDWGIVFIVLTNYMTFNGSNSKTVISGSITITDKKSKFNKKIPDECNEEELIAEVFRQIKIELPNLPYPTVSIISPGIYKYKNKWMTKDSAYMMTTDDAINFKSKYDNIYTVGCHTGASKYHFTTFESAVTNAIVFCKTLNLNNNKLNTNIFNIKEPFSIIFLIKIIIIVIIILIILYIIWHKIIT